MKLNTKTKIMTRIILLISILFFAVGCNNSPNHKEYHKLKNGNGYTYQDDDLLWHLYMYDASTGQYQYSTTNVAPVAYETTTSDFTPSSETVSNFSESPAASEMAEANGTDEGGSSDSNSSDGSGMSEDGGSDTGGSDSGGDSGGGDGGGGGE